MPAKSLQKKPKWLSSHFDEQGFKKLIESNRKKCSMNVSFFFKYDVLLEGSADQIDSFGTIWASSKNFSLGLFQASRIMLVQKFEDHRGKVHELHLLPLKLLSQMFEEISSVWRNEYSSQICDIYLLNLTIRKIDNPGKSINFLRTENQHHPSFKKEVSSIFNDVLNLAHPLRKTLEL